MKSEKERTVHEVLRKLPYGLYAVGVRGNDNEMNAFIASWVTQCSFEPRLLMVAVNRSSISFNLLREGKAFSINLLDKEQAELARQLVKPAHVAGEKPGQISHGTEETGAPVLREAFAYVECEVREIYTPGDHALVIGEVVNAGENRENGGGDSLTCADLHWHYAG